MEQNRESATMSGSLLFMAPEIMMGEQYDPKKTDVYSLGVTLFNILHYKQTKDK